MRKRESNSCKELCSQWGENIGHVRTQQDANEKSPIRGKGRRCRIKNGRPGSERRVELRKCIEQLASHNLMGSSAILTEGTERMGTHLMAEAEGVSSGGFHFDCEE